MDDYQPKRKAQQAMTSSQKTAAGLIVALLAVGMLGVLHQIMSASSAQEAAGQDTAALRAADATRRLNPRDSNNEQQQLSQAGNAIPKNVKQVKPSESVFESSTTKKQDSSKPNEGVIYKPAMIEKYIYDRRDALGYNTSGNETSEGCKIWNNPDETTIYNELHAYREEIVKYWEAVLQYTWAQDHGVVDVRKHLQDNVCQHLELKPGSSDLQEAFFPSGQLSWTASAGYIEPLAPPMRHPNFCLEKKGNILNVQYMVHDFASMCRQLKPTSRVVLFDLGASPKFAGASSPMWKFVNLFNQFGFKFDHIYAYEIKYFDANQVYQLVPRHLQSAYHWINAGVSIEEGHNLNPWTLLESEFTEDDLVLVKLDIDTSSLEVPLAKQLLNTPKLWKLVDHFYFEHHVQIAEKPFWAKSWGGSIKDTLELFHGLRQRGIPAHFWV